MTISSGHPSVEFTSILNDLKAYLSSRRASGLDYLPVSEKSQELVSSWGEKKNPEPPFFCQGPDRAQIVFVDSTKDFYSGQSGQLLVKIIRAMKLTPEKVFICHTTSLSSLKNKLACVCPQIVITLGEPAARLVLQSKQNIAGLRDRFHRFETYEVMPTYHPKMLLKQPQLKRQVWEDMKQVMAKMGIRHDT